MDQGLGIKNVKRRQTSYNGIDSLFLIHNS